MKKLLSLLLALLMVTTSVLAAPASVGAFDSATETAPVVEADVTAGLSAAPTKDIIYVQSENAKQVTLDTMKTWGWSTHYFAYADSAHTVDGITYYDDIIQLVLEPSEGDGQNYIGCCSYTGCTMTEGNGVFYHNYDSGAGGTCPVYAAGKVGAESKTELVYLGTTASDAYEFEILEAEVSATVTYLGETVPKFYYEAQNTIKQSDLTVKAIYKNASDERKTFTVDTSEYTLTDAVVNGQDDEPKVTYNGHSAVVPYSWMDDMSAIDDPTANAPFDTAKTGASDRFSTVGTYGEAVYDNETKSPSSVAGSLTDNLVKSWETGYHTYGNNYPAYHFPYDVQYTVAYQPYNSFTSVKDENGYNQAANGSYSFKSDENVYLYGYNTLRRGVLNEEMLHEAGLYTITARVYYYYNVGYYCVNHGWNGHYVRRYGYTDYPIYIEITQRDLELKNPTDTVYGGSGETDVTKVQNHRYETTVNKYEEDVKVEYIYNATSSGTHSSITSVFSTGEDWGNNEQYTVDTTKNEINGILWEANVLAPKDNNNYLCQFDGDTRRKESADQGKTWYNIGSTGDGQNTYYKGENATLAFATSEEKDTSVLMGAIDTTFTYEADQKTASVDADGTARSTNTEDNTSFGKTAASDTMETTGWEFEKTAAEIGDTITGVFGEDLKIEFKLNTLDKGVGRHVKIGDRVDTATTSVPGKVLSDEIEENSALVFTGVDEATNGGTNYTTNDKTHEDLNKKDTYKVYDGDWWKIRIYYTKDGEQTDVVAPFAGNLDDNSWNSLHTWTSDALRACEFYGVDNYTLSIEYNGLFYTNETDQAWADDANWNLYEKFNWVYADAEYNIDIEQRKLILNPIDDLNKIYDGTNLLVRQTVDINGYVTGADDYYIDMNIGYSDTQFQKNPLNALANTLIANTTKVNNLPNALTTVYGARNGIDLDVWLAGYYGKLTGDRHPEDANLDKNVILTNIVLMDQYSENKTGGGVGDYKNYSMFKTTSGTDSSVKGTSNTYSYSSKNIGDIYVSQIDMKHNDLATITTNSKMTSMRDAVGLELEAKKLKVDGEVIPEFGNCAVTNTTPNDLFVAGYSKVKKYEMGDAAAIEKGDAGENYGRYDYDDYYLLVMDDYSYPVIAAPAGVTYQQRPQGSSKTGLSIDSDTGAIKTVATQTGDNENIPKMPLVRVDVRDYPNYLAVVDSNEPAKDDANYNECYRYSTYNKDYDVSSGTVYVGYAGDELKFGTGDKANWGIYGDKGYLVTNAGGDAYISHIGQGPRIPASVVDYKSENENGWVCGNEFVSHMVRYRVTGNEHTYRLYLPYDSLNGRDVNSAFINEAGTSNLPVEEENYTWLSLYAGYEDGAQFKFTIPQDSYLTDVHIVSVKDGNIPEFSVLDAFIKGASNTNLKIDSSYSETNNGLALTLNKIEPGSFYSSSVTYPEGNFTAIPAANDQTGGSTFTFTLDTSDRVVNNHYAIVVVPEFEKYGELFDSAKFDDVTDKKLSATYALNWDTSETNGDYGKITWHYVPYGENNVTDYSVLTYNITGDNLKGIDVDRVANLTVMNGNALNEETKNFFNPTKLVPGTTVYATIRVWRNGAQASQDKGTADNDVFDQVTVEKTLTLEDYNTLFSDRLIWFVKDQVEFDVTKPATYGNLMGAGIYDFGYFSTYTEYSTEKYPNYTYPEFVFEEIPNYLYKDGTKWEVKANKDILNENYDNANLWANACWTSGKWSNGVYTEYDRWIAVENEGNLTLKEVSWNANNYGGGTRETTIQAGHIFYRNPHSYLLFVPTILNERNVSSNITGGTVDGDYIWKRVYVGKSADMPKNTTSFDFTIYQKEYLDMVNVVKNENVAYVFDANGGAMQASYNDKFTLALYEMTEQFDADNGSERVNVATAACSNAIPAADLQTGGSTFKFKLDTSAYDANVGVDTELYVTPVTGEFGDLFVKDGGKDDVELVIEGGKVKLNYNLAWNTSRGTGWPFVDWSINDVVKAKQDLHTDTEVSTFAQGEHQVEIPDALVTPAQLVPGTKISAKLYVWRDGAQASAQWPAEIENENEIHSPITNDHDVYDVTVVDYTITVADYISMFGGNAVYFVKNGEQFDPALLNDTTAKAYKDNLDKLIGIGVYSDLGTVNFADVDHFISWEAGNNTITWKYTANKNFLDDNYYVWNMGAWNEDVFTQYEIFKAAKVENVWTLTASEWDNNGDEGQDDATAKVPFVNGDIFYPAGSKITLTVGENGAATVDGVSYETGEYAIAVPYEASFSATPASKYVLNYVKKNGDTTNDTVVGMNTETLEFAFKARSTGASTGGGGVSLADYTVKFDTDGGSSVKSQTVSKNKTVTEPSAPTKAGFTFDGWFTDKELTTAYDFDDKVTKSFTLYAKWTKDSDSGVDQWLETGLHIAYMNGYDDGTFRPTAGMTRAEAAMMIYNLLRDDVKIGEAEAYKDVSSGCWYAEATNALRYLGIMVGNENNEFLPDNYITREEFAAIVTRFAKPKSTDEMKFTDVEKDRWSYDSISIAAAYGWIEGDGDGTFRPTGKILRVEAATIMNRVLGRTPDKEYIDENASELVAFKDVEKNYWGYYTIYETCNEHDYKIVNDKEIWAE